MSLKRLADWLWCGSMTDPSPATTRTPLSQEGASECEGHQLREELVDALATWVAAGLNLMVIKLDAANGINHSREWTREQYRIARESRDRAEQKLIELGVGRE